MPAPVITSVTPYKGRDGATITIRGRYLDGCSADFNGTPAVVLFNTSREAIVHVPRGARSGRIHVTTVDGTTASDHDFEVESSTTRSSPQRRGIFSAGGMMSALVPAAITGGIAAAVFSVHQTGSFAADAVGNVAGGLQHLVSTGLSIGAQIGDALLQGVLKPFGASGQAVAQLASSVQKTLFTLFEMGMDGAIGLLKSGSKLVGGAVGLAGMGLGALGGGMIGGALTPFLGGAGMVPGAVIGAAVGAALALMVSKVLDAVSQVFGGLMSAIGKVAGVIGETLVTAIKTVLSVIEDVTQSAMKMSAAALGIAQKSGLGMGAASDAVIQGLGFGVSGQQSEGMFGGRNVIYQRGLGAAYGIDAEPGTAGYYSQFRRSYQNMKGMLGGNPLLANQMADQMGQSGLVPMANLPQGIFDRQQGTTQALQSAFAMSPAQMQQTQQNLGMLMNSFSQFVELLKNKVFAELMPYLTAGLDKTIQFVKEHGPEIGQWIRTGIQTGIKYVEMFATFLVEKVPAMLITGATWILKGIIAVAKAAPVIFEVISKGIASVWQALKKFADAASTIVGVLTMIGDTIKRLTGIGGGHGGTGGKSGGGGSGTGLALGLGAVALAPSVLRGVGGVAGRGTGGILKWLAMTPVGRIIAGGVALGTVGYEALRRTHAGPWQDAPDSFGEAVSNVGLRARSLLTGHGLYGLDHDAAQATPAAPQASGTQAGAFGTYTPPQNAATAPAKFVEGKAQSVLNMLGDLSKEQAGRSQQWEALLRELHGIADGIDKGTKVQVEVKASPTETFVLDITRKVLHADMQDEAVNATTF